MELKSKCYKQKFNHYWYSDSQLGSWIEKPTEDDQTAYCKYCKVHLNGSKSLMIRHGMSSKHQYKVERCQKLEEIAKNRDSKTRSGKQKKQSGSSIVAPRKELSLETVRQAEMRLCAYVAEHNLPLSTMDTLPGLLKALDPGSPVLQHIQCSHTKTAYILKNALAAHTLNTLAKKLQANLFSFVLEDNQRFLVILVRYYDEETRNVEDSFLNILDVESTWNSFELFQEIISFLSGIDVPTSNLLAISHYSSSTLTETPSDRIQELSQYAYIPGNIGHSFHSCTEEACKELPTPVEDLCNDIYKFIEKKKPKHIVKLKEIDKLMDTKFRSSLNFSIHISMCNFVDGIVENWDALISYFTEAATKDREKKAEIILQSLSNPIFKAYFLFLNLFFPGVKDITHESYNKTQSLPRLLICIADQVKRILKYYMKPNYVDETPISTIKPNDNRHFLTLDEVYFGIDVTALKQEADPVFYNEIQDFQMRCLNFYIVFCEQLLKKVDFTDPILQNILMLSPHRCKSDFFPSIIPLAKYFPNLGDENMYEQLDREWRLVKASGTLNANLEIMTFWNKVFDQKYELAKAKPKHPQLTRFVKSMLCLPHTSGATEKIFERVAVHNMKSKARQKRETPMINSLLLTKEKLKGTSAKDFEISDELMSLAKCANIRKH